MPKIWTTKTFTVSDYRGDTPNAGIDITAGNGDGLYDMDKKELKELRDLVDKIIAELDERSEPTFLRV